MLDKCCFCISLKNGTIIIGLLQLIAMIVIFIQQAIQAPSALIIIAVLPVYAGLIFPIALLIYAAVKECWWLTLPWLVNSGCSILFCFYMACILTAGYPMFALLFIIIGIYFYWWLAVYSFYKDGLNMSGVANKLPGGG